MKRLAPLILTLLLLAGDGLFKCWYSSWCEHPESSRLYLTGGHRRRGRGNGWTITRFIFDENDRVCKIEFRASVD